jgi:septum formation inhibitor MinC
MTENNNSEGTTQSSVDGTNGEATSIKTYTEEAYLKVLSEKDNLKQKLRQLEADFKSAPNFKSSLDEALLEKSKALEELKVEKEKFNQLQTTLRESKLSAALSTALDAAGAKSQSTVMKLIDKSLIQFDENGEVITDTVVKAVQEIQKSDSILFGDVPDLKSSTGGWTPPGKNFSNIDAKRAGEGDNTQTAFMSELKAAKTQQEIMAIAVKYGKA